MLSTGISSNSSSFWSCIAVSPFSAFPAKSVVISETASTESVSVAASFFTSSAVFLLSLTTVLRFFFFFASGGTSSVPSRNPVDFFSLAEASSPSLFSCARASSNSRTRCACRSSLLCLRSCTRSSLRRSRSGWPSIYMSRPSLASAQTASQMRNTKPKNDFCVINIREIRSTRTMITYPPATPNAEVVEMQMAPPSTPPPVLYVEQIE